MQRYRVTFYTNTRRPSSDKLVSETLWVEANSDQHAVLEATMLAMGGRGGGQIAQAIWRWIVSGQIHNVYACLETN